MEKIKFKGKEIKVSTAKRRVRAFLRASNESETESGMIWYNRQRKWIRDNANGLELYKAAGIFAALSPQMSVPRNEELFLQYLKKGKASHYGALNKKCDAIMHANTACEVNRILNGNKIQSFYYNLMFPHRNERVTIDRHALSCILQTPTKTNPIKSSTYNMTDSQYKEFERIYREVAAEHGITGNQLQAITWETYRRIRKLK